MRGEGRLTEGSDEGVPGGGHLQLPTEFPEHLHRLQHRLGGALVSAGVIKSGLVIFNI